MLQTYCKETCPYAGTTEIINNLPPHKPVSMATLQGCRAGGVPLSVGADLCITASIMQYGLAYCCRNAAVAYLRNIEGHRGTSENLSGGIWPKKRTWAPLDRGGRDLFIR